MYLKQNFFLSSPDIVAQKLLGCIIERKIGDMLLRGKIIETEAYLADGDAAAHNIRGKTRSTFPLFMGPGTIYIHSMRGHHLMDIVTETEGVPSSVLIRAVEVLDGIEYVIQQRGTSDVENLTNGPGKFCRAFNIGMDFSGKNICEFGEGLRILFSENKIENIYSSSRIGVQKSKDLSLRYFLK